MPRVVQAWLALFGLCLAAALAVIGPSVVEAVFSGIWNVIYFILSTAFWLSTDLLVIGSLGMLFAIIPGLIGMIGAALHSPSDWEFQKNIGGGAFTSTAILFIITQGCVHLIFSYQLEPVRQEFYAGSGGPSCAVARDALKKRDEILASRAISMVGTWEVSHRILIDESGKVSASPNMGSCGVSTVAFYFFTGPFSWGPPPSY